MGYMPESVRKAIDEYKAEDAKIKARAQEVQQRNAEFDEQLAKARAELDEATDRAIENPTEANIRKETEARKKVAELTLLASGGEHRARRAFHGGSEKLATLARQAIALARTEAQKYLRRKIKNDGRSQTCVFTLSRRFSSIPRRGGRHLPRDCKKN